MRSVGVAVLAAVALGGCTTVKMVQRDGCWVRQTKKTLHGTKEEVGPCSRPQPQWVEDRLTRLVQECIAQSDYRWQLAALSAWNRGEPLPVQESPQAIIEICMNEAAGGTVTQNETLRARLAEVSSDREELRGAARRNEDHLRSTTETLAELLGEAAKRPPPVATATASATSDGKATSENGLQPETGAASRTLPAMDHPTPPPVAPVAKATERAATERAPAPAPPLAKALTKARTPAQRGAARPARSAGCEVPAGEGAAAAAAPALAGTRGAPPAP